MVKLIIASLMGLLARIGQISELDHLLHHDWIALLVQSIVGFMLGQD